jgi:alkylhydroperoxidase family enzyme
MFLNEREADEHTDKLFADDQQYMGFVMNATRAWSWSPQGFDKLFDFMAHVTPGMSMRERGLLVVASMPAFGDSYCSLAWGGKLAAETDAATAASVIAGTDEGLTDAERELVRWVRLVVRDPNATTQADIDRLRAAGFDDQRIFGVTAFAAARMAFSAINDALGARPDAELREFSGPEVVAAVTFGRPIQD